MKEENGENSSRGTRLAVTDAKMTAWIARLTQFQRPAALLDIVREAGSVPDDLFFNDPVYRPLHEAWAAGHFARGLEGLFGPTKVRLNPDRFPDFYLRLNGRDYDFELTMVDKPERRRDREYKKRAKDPLLLTTHQPARGRQEGPVWVAGGVRKKYEKHYGISPHLLVHANFEAETLDPAKMTSACRPWATSFSSIWVLWALQFVQLFDSAAFGNADRAWRSVGVDPWAQA